MSWFLFSQNNSGGSFDHDPAVGIGAEVFIEASSADHANDRAESIGLYFNGCEDDRDCPCCGDRWSRAWDEDGDARPTRYGVIWRPVAEGESPTVEWSIHSYIHPLDGPFCAAIDSGEMA